MSKKTPPAASVTARNLEDGLRSLTTAPQPQPEPKTARPTVGRPLTTPRYTEIVAEPYEPRVRLFAKRKTTTTTTPKAPVVNEPVLLFNIAYEALRNAKDSRDPNTPDLAYELYALDIADRHNNWSETKAALIDFVNRNKKYILSFDSRTRWVQQFGQTL